jgi:hypothetical protein
MLKKLVVLIPIVMLLAVPAGAAQAKPEAKPAAAKAAQPKPAPVPEPPPQAVNIRIEVTITDQVGPGESAKKVVTMIVTDRQRNSIRSNGTIGVGGRTHTLNVDARPVIMAKDNNRISLEFGLEYLPKGASATGTDAVEPATSSLNERLVVLLESGKPVMVSQAADPISERKITVEVTATILK